MKKNYICPEIEAILFDESIMQSVSDVPEGGGGADNGDTGNDYAKKNNLGFSFYEDDEDEDV